MDLLNAPDPLLLLLPFSLAAGVDLFLALLILFLTQDRGWMGIQAQGLHPLQWVVMGGVSGLYLLELLIELRPSPALFWHNLQLLIRPLAATLLAFSLLDGLPLGLRVGGSLVGGVLGAFTHVLSWGRKLQSFLRERRTVSVGTSALAEDALVLVFLVFATTKPRWGAIASLLLLLSGLFLGGSLHHVARFGFGLVRSNLLGTPGQNPRREAEKLPTWVRRGLRVQFPSRLQETPEEIDTLFGLWGMPGGIMGVPGAGGFRQGWVVVDGHQTFFLFRHWGRFFSTRLNADFLGEEEPCGMAQKIPITHPDWGHAALFLQGKILGRESHKSQKTLDLGNRPV